MGKSLSCREVFTGTLLELARQDPDIIALTSDARGSVTLGSFADQLPAQFVEVGIAEQNEVGIAAGLATCGKKPYVCAPASFLSARSLEQIKVDVAYTGTNVKIVGVSGGVSYGALGASHHSLQDVAVMRAIPGLTVILPCDNHQTKKMTEALVHYNQPAYIRLGRSPVPEVYQAEDAPFEIGKANILLDGTDITLIGTGETVRYVLDAGLALQKIGISARVIDMHTIKPFDYEVVIKAAQETGRIITVEEHSIFGGLGSAVAECVVQHCPIPVSLLGIPDETVVTGESKEIFLHYGLTSEGIAKTVLAMLNKE